ncbi:MAG: hypothetical protein ACI4SG_01720 [Oligosphaeraceae bacterium]
MSAKAWRIFNMQDRRLSFFFAFLSFAYLAFAWDDSPLSSHDISSASGAAATAYTSMFSKADVALARSLVSGTTAVKGSLGEAVAGSSYLSKYLAKSGNWVSISPRVGSNGLDHVFLKIDPKDGFPRGLMVGESKFNTSSLGMTKDGIQLGGKWTTLRLRALGHRYLRLANVTQRAPLPTIKPAYDLTVVLKNGKTVHFWKSSSTDTWKANCLQSELAEARRIAQAYGSYLNAAGEGKIVYRSRLFQIMPDGENLTINIKDASNLDEVGSATRLKTTGQIRLNGVLKKHLSDDVRQDIKKILKSKLPVLTDKDVDRLSRELTKEMPVDESLERYGKWDITKKITFNAGIAASLAFAIDAGIQFISSGEVNWGKSALAGGAAFAGAVTSQGINIALLHSQWMAQLSKHLNCSALLLNSMTSSAVGGVIFSGLYALGGWYMGYMDSKTAIRSAIAGVGGSLAGLAAGVGTMALVAAYGTASTGTAIATLSGAAATKAILAFLGGGAVSAGGGGMAVGAAVLGGIATVAAVAVTTSIFFGYQMYDARQETKRITIICDNIDNPDFWEASWKNSQATLLIPSF